LKKNKKISYLPFNWKC